VLAGATLRVFPAWRRLPQPTSSHDIAVAQGTTMLALGRRLTDALDRGGGYSGRYCFWSTPSRTGFVLATRVERIQSDGAPYSPSRWPDSLVDEDNLLDRLLDPIWGTEGHYRILLFVARDTRDGDPATEVVRSIPESESNLWISGGAAELPPAYASLAWTPSHRCSVRVHEIRKRPDRAVADLLGPRESSLNAVNHLQRTGVWPLLSRPA
jgi:hypothetical protein